MIKVVPGKGGNPRGSSNGGEPDIVEVIAGDARRALSLEIPCAGKGPEDSSAPQVNAEVIGNVEVSQSIRMQMVVKPI